MSSLPDLAAAIGCADNHELYVQMVELEALSSYAFQGNRWLADLAPQRLPADLQARVARAKQVAIERQAIEAELPKHLLYTSGWPTTLPSDREAQLIASVRTRIAALLQFDAGYLAADAVRDRYAELLGAKPITDAKTQEHITGGLADAMATLTGEPQLNLFGY